MRHNAIIIVRIFNVNCERVVVIDGINEFEQSIGYYVGGMKVDKLKQSESKKIILGTYAMASEGLDIKTLTTLIMATPKSDVCQSVGRILRSKHTSPLVIDIIDPHVIFKNQYKNTNWFKSVIVAFLIIIN